MINFLLAALTIFAIIVIGILPFIILYLFSDLMYFFLYNVFGYRRKVIEGNLKMAFPKISEQELAELEKKVYLNLTDILVEGIKSFTMTSRQIVKRHRVSNLEVLDKYREEKKSVIAVPAHYANFEWGSLSASLQTGYNVIAFYKPLGNPWVDRFLRWSRSRYGTSLISIFETSATFEKYKDTPTIYLMAADQSPAKSARDKAYRIDFLGLNTAFLHGPEKHAINNNLDVIYVDIQRVKRGYYELELSVLADSDNELPDGEITRRYAKKLESIIKKDPANWLWSHRRWKLGFGEKVEGRR
jgi:KDO2-lipid IV(A) lauroyltransferase